jgi:hypothetical protein
MYSAYQNLFLLTGVQPAAAGCAKRVCCCTQLDVLITTLTQQSCLCACVLQPPPRQLSSPLGPSAVAAAQHQTTVCQAAAAVAQLASAVTLLGVVQCVSLATPASVTMSGGGDASQAVQVGFGCCALCIMFDCLSYWRALHSARAGMIDGAL